VEREKGIIGQEIAMYADDPAWRGWFALLGALYARHPLSGLSGRNCSNGCIARATRPAT
jgi:hypothetical protein